MSTNATVLKSPPRPDLAFRVGIVGHRPNRLPKEADKLAAMRQTLHAVLADVKAQVDQHAAQSTAVTQFAATAPILRAISPLAEGTDRMFAEEALALGYSLCCPLPFAQEEFEKDFAPPDALEENSLARFRGILQRAGEGAGVTVFALDGDRAAAPDAYGLGGRIVLNQSDLLVVVWDGHPAAGKGGTVDTLRDAIQFNVPVLWIDALDPTRWQLLRTNDDLACLQTSDRCTPRHDPAQDDLGKTVRRIVHDELALPAPSQTHEQPTTESRPPQYFRERKPWFNFSAAWKLFRDAVGSGVVRRPKVRVTDFVEQVRAEWPTREDPVPAGAPEPSEVEDWVNRRLRVHYAWSDKRGDLYADAYRSAYVLTYLMSAFAVLVALLPMALGRPEWLERTCVVLELIMLFLILLMLGVGRGRHWHERWLEYRLLAELIRQLRFLIPLGGGRPFPHVQTQYAGYGNLTQTWMYWHMRAIARATGLPSAKVGPAYVLDCLNYLAKITGGQLGFHHTTEKRSERIWHRLHVTTLVLFFATFCGIALHLALDLAAPHHLIVLKRCLVLMSAFLPALGAALAGINNQGEFARLAKRSAAMADGFERFTAPIKALQDANARDPHAPKLAHVIPMAGKVAEVMVDEVADWRVVFIDRPQTAA
jgi:hypothetical protein